MQTLCKPQVLPRAVPKCRVRSQRLAVKAQLSGKELRDFNEGNAQVKRLIGRDRRTFLGNENDILDKFEKEFGENAAEYSQASTSTTTTPASSTAIKPADASPFKSTASSPFGTSSASPFTGPSKTNKMEPKGLSPNMSPDPIAKEQQPNMLQRITLTQIVLVCSFSLIIATMLGTFSVVLNSGAVRLAGLD